MYFPVGGMRVKFNLSTDNIKRIENVYSMFRIHLLGYFASAPNKRAVYKYIFATV